MKGKRLAAPVERHVPVQGLQVMKGGDFQEVLFRPVLLHPHQIPLKKKVGKHPQERSTRAEGVGGCEVTCAATLRFERLKFNFVFNLYVRQR